MKILTEAGYIDAVAVFFELTDEQLETIKNNKQYYLNKELLKEFTSAKGDNAHFYGIMNTNGHLTIMYQHIKKLKKQYKTISWWDRDIENFVIIRR